MMWIQIRRALAWTAFAWAPATTAQQADTLRLDAAVAAARAANPMLAAARLRADAAVERVPQAGALPDPRLSFGLMNRPLRGFGTEEEMTMNAVELSQMLPWPGKLGFGKSKERHLATALALDADDADRMLASRVVGVYADVAALDRVTAVMQRTRELLRAFFDVAQAMYAVGSVPQQDVLQAQVAIGRMTEDILVMRQERVAMAARLNALLGREATAPVGPLELPPPGPALPSADSLMALATARRPALAAARERVLAAQAGVRQARRELYPDVMLGLSYGQRPRFGDMASLMVGVTVPLWAGSRQLPMRREMEAMGAMEDAMARDMANETYAMVVESAAVAERARNLTDLYATAILPQARAGVEAALSAYRVGRADYMTLINAQMTVNQYESELFRLAAAYTRARAEVEALTQAAVGGDR
jgi:outer membrane protein TolC